jgi:tRNA-dihydrouridine synthase 3
LKHKAEDIDGICPVFEERGYCASGWRCRWLKSHTKEVDGELILVVDEEKRKAADEAAAKQREEKIKSSKSGGKVVDQQEWEKELPAGGFDDPYGEIVNNVPMSVKIAARKRQLPCKKSDVYIAWWNKNKDLQGDNRAAFVEPPPKPEEKRRLYLSRETPVLAPLTTTGNMPFRRLCVAYGAGLTYSEMAMATPILQGHKPEWALMRAHASELPNFGAQICASKVDAAVKVTETLTNLFPSAASGRHGLAFVDLNCGCPIDLVYQSGGGSALLDQQSKLINMLKGMNYVSGETPITVKIRMGTRDNNPTAQKLINRLIDHGDVQSITLHGRSRQQRYTRTADWEYIAQTAALIDRVKAEMDATTDTAADKDRAEKPPVYFVGNGDCYSHIDYYNAVDNARVDTVMLARGALIKPWLFEEIKTGQYLDKSATERLDMIKDYCRYGLECWGADELGVATTRRFLLEWLSFTCRYVPIGILERLPPKINDRPPPFKGRNEMETLLSSHDYKDWIKISEMFLGPCPEDFFFTPKHKVRLNPQAVVYASVFADIWCRAVPMTTRRRVRWKRCGAFSGMRRRKKWQCCN